MQRVSFPFLLCAALIAAPLAALAQSDPCLRRSVPVGFALLPGTADPQIPLADWKARVQGNPVRVISLVADDRPHRIVLLLDASARMDQVWDLALTIAASFADSPLPNAQIALLIFGDGIRERIGFSPDNGPVRERLRQLRAEAKHTRKLAEGRRNLPDALLAGLALLNSPTSADSLFLISAADPALRNLEGSRAATDRLIAAGVRLFASIVDKESMLPMAAQVGKGGPAFAEDVQRTGGELISVPLAAPRGKANTIPDLSNFLNLFLRYMVQNARMEIELPERLAKPHSWDLKLQAESAKKWKTLTFAYPLELAACTP